VASASVIRVLVVGNVRVSREGLASLLSRDSRLEVRECPPLTGGLRQVSDSVDVIVVDTSADASSPALLHVVGDTEAPVVALGAPADDAAVIALAELGVVGFVECDGSLDDLVATLIIAARGQASCPPRVATTLLRRVSSLAARQRSLEVGVLTVRERQVVQLIGEELSNKEIASRLGIEVATVKNHVHNILEKLDVNRRSDAVARLRVVESEEMPTALELARARFRSGSKAG
jgi:two-component system nitrate/nitrite response regulator NarL